MLPYRWMVVQCLWRQQLEWEILSREAKGAFRASERDPVEAWPKGFCLPQVHPDLCFPCRLQHCLLHIGFIWDRLLSLTLQTLSSKIYSVPTSVGNAPCGQFQTRQRGRYFLRLSNNSRLKYLFTYCISEVKGYRWDIPFSYWVTLTLSIQQWFPTQLTGPLKRHMIGMTIKLIVILIQNSLLLLDLLFYPLTIPLKRHIMHMSRALVEYLYLIDIRLQPYLSDPSRGTSVQCVPETVTVLAPDSSRPWPDAYTLFWLANSWKLPPER